MDAEKGDSSGDDLLASSRTGLDSVRLRCFLCLGGKSGYTGEGVTLGAVDLLILDMLVMHLGEVFVRVPFVRFIFMAAGA